VPEFGIGAGLDSVEIGVRLRYEIVREFAPYIGVEQSWRVGRGAVLRVRLATIPIRPALSLVFVSGSDFRHC